MDYLDGDARNMAMILWAIKRHKGEQRVHSGVWKKVAGLAAQTRLGGSSFAVSGSVASPGASHSPHG